MSRLLGIELHTYSNGPPGSIFACSTFFFFFFLFFYKAFLTLDLELHFDSLSNAFIVFAVNIGKNQRVCEEKGICVCVCVCECVREREREVETWRPVSCE